MADAPFKEITMKVPQLWHLLDKAGASWRRALAERQMDLVDETFAEIPNIVSEIGIAVDLIEIAFDDLFVLRAAYTFARRHEVRVLVEDMLHLLMETDFS